MEFRYSVNGVQGVSEIKANLLLVDFLRDTLGLTGTKNPLDYGQTGACTVLLNGQPVKSSMMLAIQANDTNITTIEGLADSETIRILQASFKEYHAVQCGYCTPAVLLVLKDLLDRIPNPTELEVRKQLDSVLCRCTGYQNIVLAALDASKNLASAS
jgi:aerobic carbon-monoxide dehydrogenase small subunit